MIGGRRGWLAGALAAIAALAAGLVAIDRLLPPPIERGAALSPLVLDRKGQWLHAYTTGEGRWRFRADLDDIDPVFIERLVAIEDKRFYDHAGVDPVAMVRALVTSLKAGRIVSGGSTITMQTARLLEPRPRTIPSKLAEMYRAAQIERRLTKREILELYLTLTPYGGNIEGVRAASLLYFGKEPKRLNDAEQALLIALPQAPEARRPDRRAKAAIAARREILDRLAEAGAISTRHAREADETPPPASRTPFPRAAYHFTRQIARERRNEGEFITRTTLDLALQRALEEKAAAYGASLDDGGLDALVVVDARTRGLRAVVGSSSLDAPGGWIDLTRSVRSPGSALKPFIYGLAFDDGLIGPDTVIDDMPRSFSGYSPENFDRTFRGEVRASDALQHSLNLPAVQLLDRLGAPRLAALLQASGADLEGPKAGVGDFGLTLALGGAGTSVRDVAMLYAGLAREGVVAPLVVVADDETADPAHTFQIMSAQSAYRILDILAEAPALEGRAPAALTENSPRVAFKTGTSYGFRDAWAAGVAGDYAAVAWVGRADGAPRPGATGRKAAAPLLLDVFDIVAKFDPDGAVKARPYTDDHGAAIARLAPPRRERPPEITFPRDGVELFASGPGEQDGGYRLAARGGAGAYRWYVDGDPVSVTDDERTVWRPAAPGFYDLTVVDADGRSARAKVRVVAGG